VTPLPTGTATITATIIQSDKLEIKDLLMVPNPYNPGKGNFGVRMTLTRQVVKLSIRIYTVSFRRIVEETENISASGQVTLSFAMHKFSKLGCGMYYVVITGETAGGEKAASKPEELIILK